MTAELLPCPFCGNHKPQISEDAKGNARWVYCTKCECDGPCIPVPESYQWTAEECRAYVVKEWNARKTNDAICEATGRLQAWIRDFGDQKQPEFIADLETVLRLK
jgi:hypothetical protein